MTREVKSNFKKLQEYVENYSLTDLKTNTIFQGQLLGIHRNYTSLLTITSELIHQNDIKNISELSLPESFFDYLLESTSDIGNAIFCWIHGAYKPSKIMMRCSIENFVRSIGSIQDVEFLTEKNIYKLFETANNTPIFREPALRNSCYKHIREYYKQLCADVHTANKKHMVHVSALKHFPHFDKSQAKDTEKIIIAIINVLLSFLCVTFKETFFKMHHRNQENILISLCSEVKNCLHGID